MRVSTGGATSETMSQDPLERLLDAEASLADQYERAEEDAARFLSEARARAEALRREAATLAASERARIAERLGWEREAALAELATETARETARYAIPPDRVEALAGDVVDALFAEMAREGAS